MHAPLSTDLDDPAAIPYFLWDEPMTAAELRVSLATASEPERDRLLGKILREARDTDVWRFVTPAELSARRPRVARHLGRRKAFWEFLLGRWRQAGLLALAAGGLTCPLAGSDVCNRKSWWRFLHHEAGFFLSGGAALAGFHLGHCEERLAFPGPQRRT